MIVTIHQPEHMPWSGFFHKMSQADVYVLLDNVQFKKNNWQNRNRIIARNGQGQWLTVPVKLKGHIGSTIKEIQINDQDNWRRKYCGRISDAYCRHKYFKVYAEHIFEIIDRNHTLLRDLNRDLIDFFREILGIKNRLVWASDLDVTGSSTELLTAIIKQLEGKSYISGPDGKNYLDMSLFNSKNIDVTFHHFEAPVYESPNGFLPNLSTLDLIMNFGEETSALMGIKESA